MSERKNVQTEHKWVGQAGWDDEGPQFRWSFGDWKVGVRDLKLATLFDSPTDVPDDCTPVRVRVETWTEEGEPEPWDGKNEPNGFQIVVTTGGPGYVHLDSFTPVRIPAETKRKVTLDPEPTETGCRCREALESIRYEWYDSMAAGRSGAEDRMATLAIEALADCDCKAPETVQ